MEMLLVGLFVAAVSYFLNSGERARAKMDALELQHDSQEFESQEADKAREFQEDFFLKYESPEALMSQYRKLGASESASLMSALGVSPSPPSPVKASSSPAGGLGTGVNTMSDLLNSLTGGFNQYMQGQKAGVETEWTPRVNEANIHATLSQLELNWNKFELEKDTFNWISKPLAEMALDKSRQEIEESKQRVIESNARINEIEQKIKESNQNISESNARIDLYNAQTLTEGFKQENITADTALKGAQKGLVESQTVNQDIQNIMDGITRDMCTATGLDVRLSWQNNNQYKLDYVADRFVDVILGRGNKAINLSWSDFSKAVTKTYDGLLHGINNQVISKKAFNAVHGYFENLRGDSSYKKWYRSRGKSKFKNAQDWIRENTRYGM